MLTWVLSAFLPCEFSSTFTSLLCLWLCIQPSWGLLSAFHCIPHWFGLVCELRRTPPRSVQSGSGFKLQVSNNSVAPPRLFSEPEEIKQCDKIKLLFYCMWRNCQYLPQCTWPFGKTFTSSAGCKMEKKTATSKPWSQVTKVVLLVTRQTMIKNRAHRLFILDQDLKIVTDWKRAEK